MDEAIEIEDSEQGASTQLRITGWIDDNEFGVGCCMDSATSSHVGVVTDVTSITTDYSGTPRSDVDDAVPVFMAPSPEVVEQLKKERALRIFAQRMKRVFAVSPGAGKPAAVQAAEKEQESVASQNVDESEVASNAVEESVVNLNVIMKGEVAKVKKTEAKVNKAEAKVKKAAAKVKNAEVKNAEVWKTEKEEWEEMARSGSLIVERLYAQKELAAKLLKEEIEEKKMAKKLIAEKKLLEKKNAEKMMAQKEIAEKLLAHTLVGQSVTDTGESMTLSTNYLPEESIAPRRVERSTQSFDYPPQRVYPRYTPEPYETMSEYELSEEEIVRLRRRLMEFARTNYLHTNSQVPSDLTSEMTEDQFDQDFHHLPHHHRLQHQAPVVAPDRAPRGLVRAPRRDAVVQQPPDTPGPPDPPHPPEFELTLRNFLKVVWDAIIINGMLTILDMLINPGVYGIKRLWWS